jgi:hypothetical protein
MNKINLNLEDLSVDTFHVGNDPSKAPGTVRGQIEESDVKEHCWKEPIYNTQFGATCNCQTDEETCYDACESQKCTLSPDPLGC